MSLMIHQKYQTIPIHTTSGGNGVSSVNPYD